MEPTVDLIDIAEQVPGLAVLAFIVVTFLRHLDKRDTTFHETMAGRDAKFTETIQERDKVLYKVSSACELCQTRVIQMLEKNTEKFGEITNALNQARRETKCED